MTNQSTNSYPVRAWFDGGNWRAAFEVAGQAMEISGPTYEQLLVAVKDDILKRLHRGKEAAMEAVVEP